MALPPLRKPAAVPANNGRLTSGLSRQRILPPPPADSDAYSTDSDSSADSDHSSDKDIGDETERGPTQPTGDDPAGDTSCLNAAHRRKSQANKLAAAAAAAAATKRFQQQQQLLIREQRKRAIQNASDSKTGPTAGPSKPTNKALAGLQNLTNSQASLPDTEDEYDLGLGPSPSKEDETQFDMDIDGQELWTHCYCVVCDRLIAPPTAPDAESSIGSGSGTAPPSPLAGPSPSDAASKKADHAPSGRRGSAAPVKRNYSSGRLSTHSTRSNTSSHAPKRTGSTGSRLNALSNLKPTTKLHQDKARSSMLDTESGKGQLSRADSSTSIASRTDSSSNRGGSPPPPSIASQGYSSASSAHSRRRPSQTGPSIGEGPEPRSSKHEIQLSQGAAAISRAQSSSGKEKATDNLARPPKNRSSLYCSERCRLIDEQRSLGLGELRPYLSQPVSAMGSMGNAPYPYVAPAAIAVTTVGSDQPAAVIPVASSTLSLGLAAASRSDPLPVLAATAVVAASASGARPMMALVELARSSAAGNATLSQGLSMSIGRNQASGSAAPYVIGSTSAAPMGGRPVLTAQVATPLAPIDGGAAYFNPSSLPAGQSTPRYWPIDDECPDCCMCPECALADEAEARTTSGASGTAPSGSGASDTATSESSYALMAGAGLGGSDGIHGKGKQRTASGRLLTPHNLMPLNENDADYFGAYPETMRKAMLEQARMQNAASALSGQSQNSALNSLGSPEAAAALRRSSLQSAGGNAEAAYVAAALGGSRRPDERERNAVRQSRRTSNLSEHDSRFARPTSSASTSFSAAATVMVPSAPASNSDGPGSSAITAVPADSALGNRSRSTSVPGSQKHEHYQELRTRLMPRADGEELLEVPESDAAMLGTSLGTALHRSRSTITGNDSICANSRHLRTSSASHRGSGSFSASTSSPLKLLQRGEMHHGTPSVGAVNIGVLRGLADSRTGSKQDPADEREQFSQLKRRVANWSADSQRESEAVSIVDSGWRKHRRAESEWSSRSSMNDTSNDSLNLTTASQSISRPMSVGSGNGLGAGALDSLKRAQALAMGRELDRERLANDQSADSSTHSMSGTDVSTSVSMATSLDAVREGRQEHHRRPNDDSITHSISTFRRGGAESSAEGAEPAKRRYSTGGPSQSGTQGFFSSIWSSLRSSNLTQKQLSRTETAPASSSAAVSGLRATQIERGSATSGLHPETKDRPHRSSSSLDVDPDDQALITATDLGRGDTIKPTRSGRTIANAPGGSGRRFDSLRSDTTDRDETGSNVTGRSGSSKRSGNVVDKAAKRHSDVPDGGTRSHVTTVAKPTMRRGSVPFFTQEIGHGHIPGDSIEDFDARARSPSHGSHTGPPVRPEHRHSISNGAAAGVESVERRRLARLEQQRAHRHQRSRDVSMLPPLLAPDGRSNSASSTNLRLMHTSSPGFAPPGSTRASSHGRVPPGAVQLGGSGYKRSTTPASMMPPALRSPRSFQGMMPIDPLVAGMGFSPARSTAGSTPHYGTSPRGRGLGWGSSMTPLTGPGSGPTSAAITPVASGANLAAMGQPQSYTGSFRLSGTHSVGSHSDKGQTTPRHQHHHHHHHHHQHGHVRGHAHSQSHSQTGGSTQAYPPLPMTGHFATLGAIPPSHSAHYSRHATMPTLMYSRSVTPSVPEHGGEMSSEALAGASALPHSPNLKMYGRAGSVGFIKPAMGPTRPRSGLGRRSESPASITNANLPVGAIEGITLLTPQQYQEHLQNQQQRERNRRTWSYEALSSMAGSGKTYPIMPLPGNGEVHDRYDEEWTSLINSTRRSTDAGLDQEADADGSRGDGATGDDGADRQTPLATPGAGTQRTTQRKALFHFG
ncbi:hypothetical protein OC846_004059 [Tilletia horrida]|uniref:Uncharacterized protein n=1 Tax=Tilletia horrida TaxID=155126 RepID=A0AAN6GNY9_9BASI|nr:hypothetical protein OC846_004059 [Tilletia horrida]KAK0564679.1 hypothetical protein OC861_004152 [Tilletia horrida]